MLTILSIPGTNVVSHPMRQSLKRPLTQNGTMRSPLSTTYPSQLLDLVSHIQIPSELPIAHHGYPPSETSVEVIAQWRTLPRELQQAYLSTHLRNYLHDIYYSGELKPLTVEVATPVLKNDRVRGVDASFYAQLHEANQGTGYFDPEWQVVQHHADGRMAVKKDGLVVQIEPHHLQIGDRSPQIGALVAIHLPRNRVEPGYYIAVGNAGLGADDQTILELCFHLTAEGAIALMHALTTQLNTLGIPFSFKVLMHPSEYGRYDAGVLHLARCHYPLVHPLLQEVYGQVRSHIHPATPLFTKVLAPGVGLAEEPEVGQFGLHRCQLVADALLRAQGRGDRSPEACLRAIHQGFQEEGLDLQRPYLNLQSDDIYTLLIS